MASEAGGIKNSIPQFQKSPLTTEQQEKKIRNVAEMYEQQFLQEMVKAMRGTVQESGLIKVSQGERIYRDQMDQNYSEQWAKKGGIGLGDMIYKQLTEKLGQKLGPHRPQGPLKIDESSNFTGMVKTLNNSSNLNPNKVQFQFSLDEKIGPADLQIPSLLEVRAPWGGKITNSQKLNADEYLLEVLHDNNAKSQIVFRGQLSKNMNQGLVQAGESIGLLSPEAKSLFWSVEANSSDGPMNRNTSLTE